MYRPVMTRTINTNNSKSFVLDKFLGVDYTSGEFNTDYRRSPDASNIIWGVNPYHIETRPGTKRILLNKIMDGENEAIIYGIHTINNTLLVHAGSKLYLLSGDMDSFEATEIATGLTEQKSKPFTMNGKLYIIGTGSYLEYDPDKTSNKLTEVTGFIPTTVINRHPDGGGTAFEAVNLLSTRRKNSFYAAMEITDITDTFTGDGTTAEFTLSESKITYDDFTVIINDIEQTLNEDYTVDRIEKKITFTSPPLNLSSINVTYKADTGLWISSYQLDSTNIDYTAVICTVDGVLKEEGTDYIVDRENGLVTFNTAPQSTLQGVDNVVIEFAKSSGDVVDFTQTETGDGETTIFDLITSYPITNDAFVVEINSVINTEFTVDRVNKTITFDDAPENDALIEINYSVIQDTRADVIKNCTIYGIFGGRNDTRVFLSGNINYPNRDWQSELYDATYFPDTGYTDIGTDSFKIMGYIKQYDTQMIIKEGNQQDGSAFLRTFAIDNNGTGYFPIEQGAVGIGAVSTDCFGYIQGEPLFLSSQGVVGVSGTNVDNQRLIQDKSEKINSMLIDDNLLNAFAVEYKNKYYLFSNGKIFVCDARMRYTDTLGNVQYEWQNWDNVNATCATVYNGYLLFGYGGMVFRFKLKGEPNYYIDEDYNGNFAAIESYWTTPKLYFNSIANRKNLDYLYLMFGSARRLNAKIECVIDDDITVDLGTFIRIGNIHFSDIDFSSFSFGGESTSAKKITTTIRNFDNVQFKVSNDNVNSGIGLEILQAIYRIGG